MGKSLPTRSETLKVWWCDVHGVRHAKWCPTCCEHSARQIEVVPKVLLDGIEDTLDALLNGLDNYRTREIPGTGISADLRELVDAANESRNATRKAARS